ncbi:hypothetical protein NGM67_03285 [Photobacterium damselae]|uniref:hypothetical protein n=1 Tax=Photobacterium damselae TaxID=38293 RepID=UPI002090EF54|nr:hypothetical protein [Photobacterium damselae]USR75072.1 hypothetical protein NGM67_03285 [Photobacterium damselae]
MTLIRNIFCFLFLAILCSCGSDKDDSVSIVDVENYLYKFTNITYTEVGTDKVIDLSDEIGDLKIKKIRSKSEYNCISKKNDHTIIASNVTNDLCTAEVYYGSAGNKGLISISSLEKENTSEDFNVISKTVISNDSITIDVKAELGADFPEGYILDSELIIMGSAEATSDPVNNKILVNTDKEDDITKIIYIYKSELSDDTRQGILFISNSMKENNSPVAKSNLVIGSVGEEIEIDLKSLSSDLDLSDNLHLIELYSLSHYESIKDDSIENTKFYFNAEKQGIFDVFYILGDDRGGIASNVIRFNINGYLSFKPIYVESVGLTFYPPKAIDDVEGIYDFTSFVKEDGSFGPNGFTFPTFNKDVAQNYCYKQGLTLPTLVQLSELYKQEYNEASFGNIIFKEAGWPSTAEYFSLDGSMNLQNGVSSSDMDKVYYVSCVGLEIKDLTIPFNVVVLQSKKAQLYALGIYNDGTSELYNKSLYWEIIDGDLEAAKIDSSTGMLTLYDEGIITVKATNDDGISTIKSLHIVDNMLSMKDGEYNEFDSSFELYTDCFINYLDMNDHRYPFGGFLPKTAEDKPSLLDNMNVVDDPEYELALLLHEVLKPKIGAYNNECLEYLSNDAYFLLHATGALNNNNLKVAEQGKMIGSFDITADFLSVLGDLDKTYTFVISFDAIMDSNALDKTIGLTTDDYTKLDFESEIAASVSIHSVIEGITMVGDRRDKPLYAAHYTYNIIYDYVEDIENSTYSPEAITIRNDLTTISFEKLYDDKYRVHSEIFFDYKPSNEIFFLSEELEKMYFSIRFETTKNNENYYTSDLFYASSTLRLDNLSMSVFDIK